MTFTSLDTRIILARPADAMLRVLGAGDDYLGRRQAIIEAARDGLAALPGSLERHFLARASVAGVPVTLLCAALGDAVPHTALIRGAFEPAAAIELLEIGRGLAPHVNATRAASAGKRGELDAIDGDFNWGVLYGCTGGASRAQAVGPVAKRKRRQGAVSAQRLQSVVDQLDYVDNV